MKILILGGGPTGLGAAWRLNELGHNDWQLLEANDYAGGLAASFRDENGFFWDIGGHVQFSHYEYFDRLMHALIPKEQWTTHERESWVWIRNRFIPYPFQNNIRRLPEQDLVRCLDGLVDLYKNAPQKPANFKEWIMANFGAGIADIFLLPYNFKVWAYPAEQLSHGWVGERVAVTDLTRVLHNLVFEKDDFSWGPNSVFQFPKHGGTGAIWNACAARLPQGRLHFCNPVQKVEPSTHRVTSADGRIWNYDALISTLPLTELLVLSGRDDFSAVAARGLKSSSTNIVGIGLKGKVPEHLKTKCWMYFPEADCPFYRVTIFSNYSPHNVPDAHSTWSVMTETSESDCKPVNQDTLVAATIQGLLNTGLINNADDVVSTWTHRARYGYPIPGLHRDEALEEILPALENDNIYSRGRFGAWKYEVSNQDHSFMQGLEIVERLVCGQPEITFRDPNYANSKKHPFPFERWIKQERCPTPESSSPWPTSATSIALATTR
jgi:protoporphyrinogen oxidase